MNLSLNQTLLTFLVCETNLDDSNDCGNFSVRGYLPLIQMERSTYIHGLAVYVKEGLPFAQDLSLENKLYFTHLLSYFFCHYQSPSLSLSTAVGSISCNIDDAPLINPSAIMFVIGDFNIHNKGWLTYSGGTNQPGELYYNLK